MPNNPTTFGEAYSNLDRKRANSGDEEHRKLKGIEPKRLHQSFFEEREKIESLN